MLEIKVGVVANVSINERQDNHDCSENLINDLVKNNFQVSKKKPKLSFIMGCMKCFFDCCLIKCLLKCLFCKCFKCCKCFNNCCYKCCCCGCCCTMCYEKFIQINNECLCNCFYEDIPECFWKFPCTKRFGKISNFFGRIMRIFFQIGEFSAVIILLNIAFEFCFILLVNLLLDKEIYTNIFLAIIFLIDMFYFSYLFVNPVSLIIWEFFQLNWVNQENPFKTIINLYNFNKCNFNNSKYNKKDIDYNCNCFFFICFIAFITVILFNINDVNYINSTFLYELLVLIIIIFSFIKYLIIFIAYIIHSIIFIVNIILNKIFKVNYYYCKLINIPEEPFIISILNSNSFDNEKIKKIVNKKIEELSFSSIKYKIFEKTIYKYSQNVKEDFECNLKKVLKYSFFVLLIFSIILNKLYLLFFILLILIILYLPNKLGSWSFYNYKRFSQGYQGYEKIDDNDIKYNNINRIINRNFKGFKTINRVISILFPILNLIIIFLNFFREEKSGFKNIDYIYNKTLQFIPNTFSNVTIKNTNILKNPICFTKIHHLDMIKIAVIAQSIYFNNTEKIKYYLKKSIFNGIDDITIVNMTIISKQRAMLMMTDIDIKNQDKIRVFSVRGTSNFRDGLLDVELFASSLMFTLIKLFPLIGNAESLISKAITKILWIPMKYLKKYTLTYQYISELSENYEKYNNTNRKIIFTGHSLGGGLAKYLGMKYKKQSVSFSGPGVTPFQSEYSNDDNSVRYIQNYFIDVIPDNDIVPAIETSSGTIYNIICEEPIFSFQCHSISRTICMMGIMCNEEVFTGNLCEGIFDKTELEKMRQSVKGKKK